MLRCVHNQHGLTLLELILSVVITAIIAGLAGRLMTTSVDIYDYVIDRKAALQETRVAMLRIARELRGIAAQDSIIEATEHSISFYKTGGTPVTISKADGAIHIDGQPLAKNIQDLTFIFYDDNQNALRFPIANTREIWQISFEIVGRIGTHEIRLANEVKPRRF